MSFSTISGSGGEIVPEMYGFGYEAPQGYGQGFMSDGNMRLSEESSPTFWPNSPRSDTTSPTHGAGGLAADGGGNSATSSGGPMTMAATSTTPMTVGPYQIYTPVAYAGGTDSRHHPFGRSNGYGVDSSMMLGGNNNSHCPNNNNEVMADDHLHHHSASAHGIGPHQPGGPVPFVRVVKRRTTANKKERRRTLSINNAYFLLRDAIKNVPADTKLSKIKTLRLATSYISYLTSVLQNDDPNAGVGGFRAELGPHNRNQRAPGVHHAHGNAHASASVACMGASGGGSVNTPHPYQHHLQRSDGSSPENDLPDEATSTTTPRRSKGRTGWPQHIWALELKQEQTL